MPWPTTPVNRAGYAEDITVWASGPKFQLLESMINIYLRDVGVCLKESALLISAPKSTVMLFTFRQIHPNITLEDTQLATTGAQP